MPNEIELKVDDTLCIEPRVGQKREFTIIKQFPAAGMSYVYFVQRSDKPEKSCVIKIAKPNHVNALRREAEALKRLQDNGDAHNHHIIRLVHPEQAMWEDSKGNQKLHFFALEYMADGSLRDLLDDKRKPLSLAQATAIVTTIGRALTYIHHQQQMVHLDVKPANILFSADRQRVVLSDFGITRTFEQLKKLTTAIGTPVYISPEQLTSPSDHTFKADIYALGVVLFEMLVGAEQFKRFHPATSSQSSSGAVDNLMSQSYEALLRTPPSQLNSDISPAVEAVILKAIAQDPAARYETVQAMVDDLQQATASAGNLPSWLMIVLGVLGVVAVGLICGGIMSLWPTPVPTPIADNTSTSVEITPTPPPAGIEIGEATNEVTTPTPSLTPTLESSPTVSPTSTRRPTITPTEVVVPPPPNIPSDLEVRAIIPNQQWFDLVSPADQAGITQNDVLFEWRWIDETEPQGVPSCARPPAGYGFEIRIWRDGRNEDGAMNAATEQGNIACDPATGIFRYEIRNVRTVPGVDGQGGRFVWDVAIVRFEPEYRVELTSPVTARKIILQ